MLTNLKAINLKTGEPKQVAGKGREGEEERKGGEKGRREGGRGDE